MPRMCLRSLQRGLRLLLCAARSTLPLLVGLAQALAAAQGGDQLPRIPATGVGTEAHPLALTGVNVVDVEAGRVVPNQTVVIVGNRILTVGSAESVPPPQAAQIVEARDKYLMPGLWDMHTHLRDSPDFFFRYLIGTGVTGIRDMDRSMLTGPTLDTLFQWRREIAAGAVVGPRIVATGDKLETEGDSDRDSYVTYVRTPDEARKAVAALKAAGADFVKVHSENMTPEVYFAVAAEARRLNIPFVGHLPRSVTPEEASDSGQRSIEHINEFRTSCIVALSGSVPADSLSDEVCAALGARMARNGTWFTPTLSAFDAFTSRRDSMVLRYWPVTPPNVMGEMGDKDVVMGEETAENVLADGRQLVAAAHKVGIAMLAGTDVSLIGQNIPGSVHRELELFVESELTPVEALRTATLNPAKYFHATDSLGTVAAGKLADLVLLDADPLTNITNTTKVRAVVANGRYFDRAALDTLLSPLQKVAAGLRAAEERAAAEHSDSENSSTP